VHAVMWWHGFLEWALGHVGHVTIAAAACWPGAFCGTVFCCAGIGREMEELECCSLLKACEPLRIRVRKDGAISSI
jgi:hypothetical protein